jgi:hypothetical protein
MGRSAALSAAQPLCGPLAASELAPAGRGHKITVRRIMRHVPKWIAPRLALAVLLTIVGMAALLLIPPLFDRDRREDDVGTNPAEEPADAGACPENVSDDAVRCEINKIRAAHGLAAIRTTTPLRVAAQRHSEDMVRRRYFAHVSPSGQTVTERVKRAGYRSRRVGENIGWGSGNAATPRAIVAAWMKSPPHRRIILTPDFREGGVGVAHGAPVGGDGRTYVLDVGRPR